MAKQLTCIAASLGSSTSSLEGDATVGRGKAKIRSETPYAFPFAPCPVQVELLIFTGVDPEEWLASAEDFFEFYQTEDHHRVTMASFRMEGMAKRWYRWMQRQR
ncbi:hypothetical protein HRI_001723900 [Hibiscus trionum]|uniref:Retrotransposon gag domain-containing protein n=1 Tax=Hibiscus trionum TaxID=183268 RepID=A0A9W7HNZ6_HIBTR|nr:hypothetical protein HRI_001723900 [Hibiscus trionum]